MITMKVNLILYKSGDGEIEMYFCVLLFVRKDKECGARNAKRVESVVID